MTQQVDIVIGADQRAAFFFSLAILFPSDLYTFFFCAGGVEPMRHHTTVRLAVSDTEVMAVPPMAREGDGGIGLPLAVFPWPGRIKSNLPFFIAAIAPCCWAKRVIKWPSDLFVWSMCSIIIVANVLFSAVVSLLRWAIRVRMSPRVT